MCFEKQERVQIEVLDIDVKNFPELNQLPHAPIVARDTIDVVQSRLQRARDELLRVYNERHLRNPMPLSLGTDEEVDTLAGILDVTVPVTIEYIRLRKTLKNFEQISQNENGEKAVLWMSIAASLGGSEAAKVVHTSVKEGTKNFSWDKYDIRSNINLPLKRGFPNLFRKSVQVEEAATLKFYLYHNWKPRDERAVSSVEPEAFTLAYAELHVEDLCLNKRSVVFCRDLPLRVEGIQIPAADGASSPTISLKIKVTLDDE